MKNLISAITADNFVSTIIIYIITNRPISFLTGPFMAFGSDLALCWKFMKIYSVNIENTDTNIKAAIDKLMLEWENFL